MRDVLGQALLVLRCWGRFGEAVDARGVGKAQTQPWKGFPFPCCPWVVCLWLGTDTQARVAAYESLIFPLVLLGRSGTAQMWKQPNVCYQKGLYMNENQQTGNHDQMVPLFTDFHSPRPAVKHMHKAQLVRAPKYPHSETVPEKNVF